MSSCQTMNRDTLHNSGPHPVANLPSTQDTKSSALSSSSIQENDLSASVSSLRALALSTLRTKRRKDGPNATQLPTTKLLKARDSATPNSVTLDYGSESNDTQDTSQATSSTAKAVSSSSKPQDDDADDSREEGEISDEDTLPSPARPSPPPPKESQALKNKAQEFSFSSISSPASSSRNTFTQKSPSTMHREYASRRSIPTATSQVDSWNGWIPSQNHVRPGLKMSMEQFNLAKELILDLLGWGVSPEYIVDCGLSREAVFYTFTELNLRLPKNLDVNGLLPTPPSSSTTQSISNSGEPLIPLNTNHQARGDPTKTALSHPLPPKPPTASSLPQTPLEPPTGSPTVGMPNLSDMEAQRKYELQARKAVLASRKKKPVNSIPSKPQSTTVNTIAPAEVDDFLNSMLEDTPSQSISSPNSAGLVSKPKVLSGGVSLGVANSSLSNDYTLSTTSSSQDAMEVDTELIPGLTSSSGTPDEEIPRSNVLSPDLTREAKEEPTTSSSSSRSSIPRESSELRMTQPEQSTLNAQLHRNQNIPSGNHRRGVKRPVAMDFVDIEQATSGTSRASAYSGHPPYIRRKMASFAGLGRHSSRKCVIDVSDSEDESDDESDNAMEGDVDMKQSIQPTLKQNPTVPISRPVSVHPIDNAPTPISRPASTATPEALQYEAERLRELIKKRELERRKQNEKLRSTTAPSTPPSTQYTSSPVIQSPRITALQEEITSTPQHSSNRIDSSSASEPCDQAEEDAVMQALSGPPAELSAETPTGSDLKSHVLENISTGEAVLTVEASEEKMDYEDFRCNSQCLPMKSVNDLPLAQVGSSQHESTSSFSPYQSPFSPYPLLQPRSGMFANFSLEAHSPYSLSLSSSTATLVSDVSASTTGKSAIPDLRPLRDAVIFRQSTNDRPICQFEVPGGGVCHDKTCTDVHLRDFEPSDSDIASFLLDTMSNTLKSFNASEIVNQLSQARQKLIGESKTLSSAIQLEDIVFEAVSALTGP